MRELVTFSAELHPLPRPALMTDPRSGRQFYKDGAAYREYKRRLTEACEQALPDDWVMYDGPSEIRVICQFDQANRPKSRANEVWYLKTPDSENLIKPVQDALTGLCFKDDRTVVTQRVAKCWGEGDLVVVQLNALSTVDEDSREMVWTLAGPRE